MKNEATKIVRESATTVIEVHAAAVEFSEASEMVRALRKRGVWAFKGCPLNAMSSGEPVDVLIRHPFVSGVHA